MGEVVEMMLDGTMCAGCGEWIDVDGLASGDFEPQGFPGYCSEQCARNCGGLVTEPILSVVIPPRATRDTKCPTCGRMYRGEQGYLDHFRAKHAAERATPGGE